MGLLITKSDFTGKYSLATSTKGQDNIDAYIDFYEEKFLRRLMGIELFGLFKADVDMVTKIPSLPEFLTLYNPLYYEHCEALHESEGLKKMLLGFIFFHYVRENTKKQTLNGDVKVQSEVSTAPNQTYIILRYNESVEWYNTIQMYILDNEATLYPTFKGTLIHKLGLI